MKKLFRIVAVCFLVLSYAGGLDSIYALSTTGEEELDLEKDAVESESNEEKEVGTSEEEIQVLVEEELVSPLNEEIENGGEYKISEIFPDPALASFLANFYLGKDVEDNVTQLELDQISNLSINYAAEITDLTGLSYLRNLGDLYITDTNITSLAPISNLPALSSINLRNAGKAQSLAEMKNLPSLITVTINGPLIKTIGNLDGSFQLNYLRCEKGVLENIDGLQSQTELESLYLDDNQIVTTTGLANKPLLQVFSISKNKVVSLEPLKDSILLSNLWATNNKITTLDGLQSIVDLYWLDLSDNQITNIDAVASMNNLMTLKLSNNKIVSVEPIGGLMNLSDISLSDNQIQNVKGLENLEYISLLDLSNNCINDISAFSNPQDSIENLNLENNQLTSLNGIQGLENLFYLNASNNQLTDIDDISGLTLLTTLILSHNNIASVGILENMTNLNRVDMSYNQLENISFIQSFTGVYEIGYGDLNLSHNKIQSLAIFTTIYQDSTYNGMSMLDVSNNQIESIEELSFLSTNSNSIYQLNVSNNKLTSLAGIENSKITALNASYNAISDITILNSVTGLSNIILSNMELTKAAVLAVDWEFEYWIEIIDLSNNKIEQANEVYEHLLSLNAVISEIKLVGNMYDNFDFIVGRDFYKLDLSNTGFRDLELLSKANSIYILKLSNNGLTDVDMEKFSLLKEEVLVSISQLDISHNPITSLKFLRAYENSDMFGGNLSLIADYTNISTLDVETIAPLQIFNQWNGLFSVSLNHCNIKDISGFTGIVYDFKLGLDLSANHIYDITPLYANYADFLETQTMWGWEPSGKYVVANNQTISVDVKIQETDTILRYKNKILGLDKELIEPSYSSHHGTYEAPYLQWNVSQLPAPIVGGGTVYYQFNSQIMNFVPPTLKYNQGDPIFSYTGTVSINYALENDNPVINQYALIYHGNGHTGGQVPVDLTNYNLGASATVLAAGNMKRTGYTFKTWNTSADGKGDNYVGGAQITMQGNVNLYAIWEKNDSENPITPEIPLAPEIPTTSTPKLETTSPLTTPKTADGNHSTWLMLAIGTSLVATLVIINSYKKYRKQ